MLGHQRKQIMEHVLALLLLEGIRIYNLDCDIVSNIEDLKKIHHWNRKN
jgi:hypothetical protein